MSSPSQLIKPERVSPPSPDASGRRLLYGAYAILILAILAYSQTKSFFWDEGFHILAARLIDLGKRPYLDFFFPQTPLNAYWNAGWMAVLGPSWRVVHAVAALVTAGSVILISEYLFSLFPDRDWQLAAAFGGVALFGLHLLVWEVGTLSQAYPLSLFLVVAAFRMAIVAVDRPGLARSALAGLLAAGAASSTLLTAAASPVLLVWIWLYNRAGNRWTKIAAFLGGGAVACIPVLALFARGPHQVIFNILKYHTLYRRVAWPGATGHDLGVATDWVNNSSSLLLVLLAVAGLFFIKKSGFDAARRAEFRLCVWLPMAIGAQNLLAHPTFPMYFVFLIPFLTVLAVLGFYAVVERLGNLDRPRAAVIVLLGIMAACVSNGVYETYAYTWPELEEVATKVKQVTPKDGALWAPAQIYFLTRLPVPSGLEHADAHKLQLTPAENALLHVMPKAELDQQVAAGAYSTAVICEDDEQVNALKEKKIYSQTDVIQDCTIFWQVEKKNLQPAL